MLTVGDYIAQMRHGLGKSPSTGHNLYHSLTFAGQQLYTAHDWRWRRRGPVAIPAVANQQFIDLPPDFGRMVSASGSSSSGTRFIPVTEQEIDKLREKGDIGGAIISYALSSRQESATSAPRKVLLVWPTPSNNAQWTMNLRFMGDFPAYTTNADDNKRPPIGPEYENALRLMSRAVAWETENEGVAPDRQLADAEITRLRIDHGLGQPDLSGWVGGVRNWMNNDDPDASPNVTATL